MHAHYLQHVEFEGLGSIEPWLKKAGYEISCTAFYKDFNLPDPDQVDFLIVMGGPMGVYDQARFPWLADEIKFIRDVIESGRPVLGICLGAQLIAAACRAKVYPNREKEIGWFPVEGILSTETGIFQFPERFTAFHWHGDTFDLPEGAVRLARTPACENQAFLINDRVIGLQFHVETTPESASAIVRHCADELVPARYVSTEKQILAAPPEHYTAISQIMDKVLVFLHAIKKQD